MSTNFDWSNFEIVDESNQSSQQLPKNSPFDWNQFEKVEEPKTFTPVEKTGRLLGQYGLGAVESATLPLTLASAASKAFVEAPGVGETLYRKEIFKDIAQMAAQKQTGVWNEQDEKLFQSLQEQIKQPEKIKESLPKELPSFDPASLIEHGLKKAGIDLTPQGWDEQAVRWMGFIKDPRKIAELSKIGIDLMKGPEKWAQYAKALLPTVKEVTRGVGAASALEYASEAEFGPLGKISSIIIGDMAGGGVPGLAKGALEFAKSPLKNTRAALARGVAETQKIFTNKDQLQLQRDLINQFREAGIQADLGSITGSNVIKTIQSRLAQSGLTGTALEKLKDNLTKQIVTDYEKLADTLGKSRFATIADAEIALKEGVETAKDIDINLIRNLYDKSVEAGKGKNIVLEIPELAKKISDLEQKILPGNVKSGDVKEVLSEIENLKKDIYDSQGNLKPASVSSLVNDKRNLNDMINWEVQGGAKNLLKGIVHDLDQTLLKYGNSDRNFLKYYSEANAKFANHAKTYRNKQISKIIKSEDAEKMLNNMNTVSGIRKLKASLGNTEQGRELFNDLKRAKFEDLIMKNMIDGATNQLKMGKFANLLDKGNNRAIARELLGEQGFKRLERLQNSTGKLAESAQKFFNSSRTETSRTDIAVITKLLFDVSSLLMGNPWHLVHTAGGLLSARLTARLMADPEFLKLVEEGMLAGNKGNIKSMQKYFKELYEPILAEEAEIKNSQQK